MTRRSSPTGSLLFCSAVALLLAPGQPSVAERTVACAKVPAVVLEHAKAEAPNATTRGCVKDKAAGKLEYEVETVLAGKTKDMTFDAAGNLLEVEQEVNHEAIPTAVAKALAETARGGEVAKVESLTRGGALVRYESTITRHGRRYEVAFQPDGTPVKPD